MINLQENIHRIKQMMGVINEDDKKTMKKYYELRKNIQSDNKQSEE